MKIVKNTIVKGKQHILVEVETHEQLMVVNRDAFYKLAYPHEDIVLGDTIIDAQQVTWCIVEQKWLTV